MVSFNEIMSLVMPSLVALLFYSKLSGKSLSLFEAVTHFALFSLITNCVMYGILIYFLKTDSFIYTSLFTFKYTLMALVISLLLVLSYRFIELNVKLKLQVERENG